MSEQIEKVQVELSNIQPGVRKAKKVIVAAGSAFESPLFKPLNLMLEPTLGMIHFAAHTLLSSK